MLEFLTRRCAGVVLPDISLPDRSGRVCVLKSRPSTREPVYWPRTCVLAISNHNERSIMTQMLQNGASGYLLKNSSSAELTRSILGAIQGNLSLIEEVKCILTRGKSSCRRSPKLNRRKKELLKMAAKGLTIVAIAQKLFIGPLIVETHRRNLMQKLK